MLKYIYIFIAIFTPLLSGCDRSLSPSDKPSKLKTLPQPYIFKSDKAPIKATIALSSSKLSLLDTLSLTVTIESDHSVIVRPFFLPPSTYAPLNLIRTPKHKKKWSEDNKSFIQSWIYQLEPLSSGSYALAPFEIFFQLKKDKPTDQSTWKLHRIKTSSIPYIITPGVISPDKKIRDIKGFILVPFNFTPMVISLSVIVVLFLLIQWVRYQLLKNERSTPEKRASSYKQTALEELRKLEQQEFNSADELKNLHTKLSDIIRKYIENDFKIPAREQTTEEFIRQITTFEPFSFSQRKSLTQFLNLADLVKFATFSPEQNASREALQQAKDFVTSTSRETDGV